MNKDSFSGREGTGKKGRSRRETEEFQKRQAARGLVMTGGHRVDPYLNFRSRVEIDGIQQGGFMECTGLGSQVEVVEYREGGAPASVRKLAGRVHPQRQGKRCGY